MVKEPSYSLSDILEVQAQGFPKEGLAVCVTGGRDFDDLGFVWSHLDELHYQKNIAHIGFGCAAGVDALALSWANYNKVPWLRYVADWDRWGKSAGSIRNIVMLEDFEPHRLLVYPGGVGTTHCTRSARKRGIERTIFELDEGDPFADAARWG